MLCDQYKKALIEAAASGAALPNRVREHVDACAHCASVLAGEQTLFAAVDAGLQRTANTKVRSSFLKNVKTNLATETVPTRGSYPGWALVCATGALALATVFLIRGAHEKAPTGAITVPSKAHAGGDNPGLSFASERKSFYSARAFNAPKQQDVSANTSREPQVLIQPGEEESLKRFYAAMRNPAGDARAIVTDEHEIAPKSLVIEQIEVKEPKFDNLDEESGLARADTN